MDEEKKREDTPGRGTEAHTWDLRGVQESSDPAGPREEDAVREHSGRVRTHSSSHRHRSSRRRRRRSGKLRGFISRHRWALVNGIIVLIFAGVVAGAFLDAADRRADLEEAISLHELEEDVSRLGTGSYGEGVTVSAPYFYGEPVLVCDVVSAYLSGNEERLEIHMENADPADEERPVTLRFAVLPPEDVSVTGYVVEVYEEENEEAVLRLSPDAYARSAELRHLKTDTDYRYRITAALSDGSETAVEGGFHTADTPRVLSIDGLKNVRDLGAWHTTGGVIRQGLLYRGSEASNLSEGSEDRAASMARLGIRTEVDLRAPSEGSETAIFGSDVRRVRYEAAAIEAGFTEDSRVILGRIFSDLAAEENYPIYLHCTDGGVRTGTVCCLLEALLGVDREDILREYALTDPYRAEELEGEAAALLDALGDYEGGTLSQRAESFLKACGVTSEEMDSIRSILTDS